MFAAVSLLADSADWGHMNGWGGGWMWLWSLPMMVFFVVVLVWLVRTSVGSAPPVGPARQDPDDRVLQILAERYARGELTTEEYRERVSELRTTPQQ